ncbi:MAG: hypothetical protein ACYTGP_06495 [Planctomycetota bacterium]|jgi:hypothetical protein
MQSHSIGVVAGLVTLGALAGGLIWSPASAQPAPGTVLKQKQVETEPEHRCRHVLAEVKVLRSEVLDIDRRLDAKAELMSVADADERLDAMQAVITEMIGQRRELRHKMKLTHQKIVGHVLRHMLVEDPAARAEGMRECPIMMRMKPRDPSLTDVELWY